MKLVPEKEELEILKDYNYLIRILQHHLKAQSRLQRPPQRTPLQIRIPQPNGPRLPGRLLIPNLQGAQR